MSYEPTVWQAGDTVTSAKLNKLEQGVAGNILFVPFIADGDTTRLGKTWQEICDAPLSIITMNQESDSTFSSLRGFICGISCLPDMSTYNGHAFFVMDNGVLAPMTFAASGPNEYPVIVNN